jgi:hypothetical protein
MQFEFNDEDMARMKKVHDIIARSGLTGGLTLTVRQKILLLRLIWAKIFAND